MTDDLTLDVGVDTGSAVSDLNKVASALAGVAGELRDAASAAATYARSLGTAANSTTATQRNSKAATTAIQAQVKAVESLAAAQRNLGNLSIGNNGPKSSTASTSGRPDIGVSSKQDIESLNASNFAREQAIKIIQRQQDAIRAVVQANIDESKAARQAAAGYKSQADAILAVQQQQAKRYATVGKASNNVITPDMQELVATANGARRVGDSFGVIEEKAASAGKSVGGLNQHLFTSRFAFNDIAQVTTVAAAALIGMNTATINAAATYESAMAQIQRTTGASGTALNDLRAQFIDLAQTIPGGFDNLAQIGQLAGQLNVANTEIASFTGAVAKFVSSTDVGVQSATEAFGRLDTLLPDVNHNYEALGSSILNVGVNSVATESAIISTTTQIAAAGAAARMSASEVIGLAASYASLGIAPEAARGSTIRIFAEIRQAVNAGGDSLNEFAKISGMTADQFKSTWESSGTQALLAFLKGLQSEGDAAETTLRNLGITGVRDINALLRLSQNLDVVRANFDYANVGFTEATALSKAFAITSETLNSKLELLGQSFQALLAQLGEGSIGPLKDFVDTLTGAIKVVTSMANNPVVQWIAGFAALTTVMTAGALIITAVAARMASFRAAVLLTRLQLDEIAASTTGANQRLIGLRTSALSAAEGIGTLRGAAVAFARSTLVLGAVMAAVGVATSVWEQNFKDAKDIAKDAGADFDALASAMKKDATAAEEGGVVYQRYQGTVEGSRSVTADWAKQVESATGVQLQQSDSTQQQVASMEQYNLVLGKNTQAALANQLANSQAFQSAIKNVEELTKSGRYTKFDFGGFSTELLKGNLDQATKMIDDWYKQNAERSKNAGSMIAGDYVGGITLGNSLNDLNQVTKEVEGSLDGAKYAAIAADAAFGQTGVTASGAATGVDGLTDSTDTATDAMTQLKGAIDAAFSFENAIGSMVGDIYTLAKGVYESGTAFDVFSGVGIANLQNLQGAIATTINAGSAMGLNANQSIAALFLQLQRMGIDTANLLSKVAGIGGTSVAGIQKAMGAANPQTVALADYMNKVAQNAQQAAAAVGGGGGSSKRSLAGGAKQAKEEVRTLLDYASDLNGIWKRAFDIRFGADKSLDAITSAVRQVSDATEEARLNIMKLNAEMGTLNADKNGLQYFLSIAEMYGDTKRAIAIRAKLGEIDADLADKAKQVADETDKTNKTLEGNSKAAIDNRATITGLVDNYQALIEQYAQSGLSQDQLAVKAQQLKQDFLAQATQLGYNRGELDKYAQAFDDVSLAIARVPRNITVTPNLNPALQALNEFQAKADAAARNAANSIATGGGQGYNVGGIGGGWTAGYNAGWDAAQGLKAAVGNYFDRYPMAFRILTQGQPVYNVPNSNLKLFKSGGYTGDTGTNDVTGITHGKEFVINAENTAKFRPLLEAMNKGQAPFMVQTPSTPGIMVVELSAFDRALLAQIPNGLSLKIGERVVAQATNAANFVSTSRGSN